MISRPQQQTVSLRRASMLGAFALLLASPAFAQMPDPKTVKITATKVAGNIHMLEGFGGNIGVSAGPDGILIVDSQYAPWAPKIKAALKGISNKPVRFVINTHHHADHTNGNESFATATIVAHENARKHLATQPQFHNKKMLAVSALPVITFKDNLSVHFNGEEIRAIHLPAGHTAGDSVIHFVGSNVFHFGDHLFVKVFPFIDLHSGGTVKGYIANLERLVKEIPADAKVIPGHGPLATLADMQASLEMLKETTVLVQAALKAGKTVEQMKAEKLLAKYDSFAWEFLDANSFLELLHRDATSAKTAAPSTK
jgi:cyclase